MYTLKNCLSDNLNLMKRSKYLNLVLVLIFQFFVVIAVAEMTGPSDPGGGPEAGDPPLGGGAPVGSGAVTLLLMAAAYGGKKYLDLRKQECED